MFLYVQERHDSIADDEIPELATRLLVYFPYICTDRRVLIGSKRSYIAHANILCKHAFHYDVGHFQTLCKCCNYGRATYALKRLLAFLIAMMVKFYLMGMKA